MKKLLSLSTILMSFSKNEDVKAIATALSVGILAHEVLAD